MSTTVVLFSRDLRVTDHPALAAAAERSDSVVPMFVLDPRVLAVSARNRIAYLVEALEALDEELRNRGAGLVLRRGDPVVAAMEVATRVGATRVHLTHDVSAYAAERLRRLREAATFHGIAVETYPGVTVVPPGDLTPTGGGDHYRVFTPYWKVWETYPWRDSADSPRRLRLPAGLEPGGAALPDPSPRGIGVESPDRQRGGLQAATKRLQAWLGDGVETYAEHHDDLAGDRTSRLGADLHFGCVSPLLLARAARQSHSGDAFVRQLAWRDFHHQVANAFPELPRRAYRPRPAAPRWRTDEDAFYAWRTGQTGVPIVDAGMRQLLREGFMHNRTRMITAAFLVRRLNVHWKRGADHFYAMLTDGDVANNYGNWQWIAGTGNDTRPNRQFNPIRQAYRFDPRGDYVLRYVPELASDRAPVLPAAVHEPWRTGRGRDWGYPPPIVHLD